MSKRILLTIAIAVMMISVPAMAAETTLNFEGTNPTNIMVMSQAQMNKPNYSTTRETSMFTLTGTGDVVGSIVASTGTYHCCCTLPIASVSGGYTASNGDFSSTFESSNLNWKSNPYPQTVPVLASATFSSQQNLSATGVTEMTVMGDASATCGRGQPLSAGQSFVGNALEVEVSAYNVRQEMIVKSDLRPALYGGIFHFSGISDEVNVELAGSAYGSFPPIDFSGHTGGEYRTYPDTPANNSSLRSSGLNYDLWVQEPYDGYAVHQNPLTADVSVYAPGAVSMPIYLYTSPTEVWGNASANYKP